MHGRAFWQLARYGVTGVSSMATYIGVLWVLVHFVSVSSSIANAAAYGVATLMNYLLNFYWSFQSAETHNAAAPRFLMIVVFGIVLNACFVWVATRIFNADIIVAAFSFAILWPAASFFGQKFWAFRA